MRTIYTYYVYYIYTQKRVRLYNILLICSIYQQLANVLSIFTLFGNIS